MRSDLIDLRVFLHHETERAVLVSDSGDREDAVWLPKSAVEVDEEKGDVIVITLRESLAQEKGLI